MTFPALERIALLSVLLLSSHGRAHAAVYHVSQIGNDASAGTEAAPWKTLEKAAATLMPGDTVLVADGTYAGWIRPARGGTADKPITYRAVNAGRAVIDGGTSTNSTNRDAFFISYTDWIVVDGFTIQKAYRAGVRIDASNHVTIRNCRCLNNGTWGIFSDYSDDIVVEGNECAYSGKEHGIYLSNSGDRPIVRRNVCHDNNACGIQLNADPDMIEPDLGTRGDGITDGALIEGNVCYNNGTAGGAAINLASVRNSRIVNNLLYNNRAGGIVGWDNANGQPDPLQYGSKNNLVAHNTVVFAAGAGRWCVTFKNGSTGNVVVNNLLVGGARGGIEIDDDSSVTSDHNVLRGGASGTYAGTNEDVGTFWTLAQWRSATGNDVNSSSSAPTFVSASAPYDFHQQPGSTGLDAGMDRPDVTTDLDLRTRPQNGKWDLGAYELAVALPGDVNGDGVVTVSDATLGLRLSAGLKAGSVEEVRRGDLAAPAGLSLVDSAVIARRAAGL